MTRYSLVEIQRRYNALEEDEQYTFESDLLHIFSFQMSLAVHMVKGTLTFYLVLASDTWSYYATISDVTNTPILIEDMIKLFQLDPFSEIWDMNNHSSLINCKGE